MLRKCEKGSLKERCGSEGVSSATATLDRLAGPVHALVPLRSRRTDLRTPSIHMSERHIQDPL
jgi:hypothetical protein